MNKSYLNEKQKLEDVESYADSKNKRFGIWTQKDADQLFGKIRRLTGRDEIRKNAIKIIVRKKLNIPENLLSTWIDPVDDSASTENFSLVEFKYIPKAERDKIPDEDFGSVNNKTGRRLFPIRSQEELDAAAKLLGRAKITEDERVAAKMKIKKIAKRKNLSLPDSWDTSEMSLVSIG